MWTRLSAQSQAKCGAYQSGGTLARQAEKKRGSSNRQILLLYDLRSGAQRTRVCSRARVCASTCVHPYSFLPCPHPRRPLLLSLHHAYAHACSRMPLAPSAHAYTRVCVMSTHAKERGGKGGRRSRHTLDAPGSREYLPASQKAHEDAPASAEPGWYV